MDAASACDPNVNPLEKGIIEGENPVFHLEIAAYDLCSESRIAWECSSNREVNFFQS